MENCSYCRALPATGRCGDCATVYCGRACQREDWLNGVHKAYCIGNRDDVYLEPFTRDPSVAPLIIVGPFEYSWYRWNGINFWFFGEVHKHRSVSWMKDALNIEPSEEQNDMLFSGTDSGIWYVARLLYAIGAAAKRKDFIVDIYLENQMGWKSQPASPDNIQLERLLLLFRSAKCLSMQRDVNVRCDFYPNARVHYGDYRNESYDLFFTLDSFITDEFKKTRENNGQLTYKLGFLQEFIDGLGKDWERRALELQMYSDDYSNDMLRWIGPVAKRCFPEYLADWFVQGLEHGRGTTRMRKQYLRLLMENKHIAELILQFVQVRIEKPVLGELSDIKHMYATSQGVIEDNDTNPFILRSTLIMDAALLFRLFRSHGAASLHRFVYVGAFHAIRYRNFMKLLGAEQVDIGKVDPETADSYYVHLNDPARDELQRLLA